eukprot:m.92294 g.92294  ORF g.92294 m.92294 type:complete len:62 (+) comp12985_c2_seq1:1073-1258(+)
MCAAVLERSNSQEHDVQACEQHSVVCPGSASFPSPTIHCSFALVAFIILNPYQMHRALRDK